MKEIHKEDDSSHPDIIKNTSGQSPDFPDRGVDDDAAEGRPNPRVAKGGVSDLTRSTEDPPPAKRQKGQNKARKFARVEDSGSKLCIYTARGQECARLTNGLPCDLSHDLKQYLTARNTQSLSTVSSADVATTSTGQMLKECPVRVIYANFADLVLRV